MKSLHVLNTLCAVALVTSAMSTLSAGAQPYPDRPLRIVVPFAPGGGADLLARLTGAKAGETLGQQIVIDNRAGAGGNIAAEVASKAAPDGYTLLQANVAHAISTTLYRRLNYDLLKDFTAVTQLAATPFILAVNMSLPAYSVKELIALAKAQPGQLSYGSSGNGGPSHLGTELFKSMAGIDVRHIPYKGGAPAATDLISGQIQMMFNTPPVILPHARAGRMRPKMSEKPAASRNSSPPSARLFKAWMIQYCIRIQRALPHTAALVARVTIPDSSPAGSRANTQGS